MGEESYQKNNWKFDDNVTQIFDSHIAKSIFFYEEIHKLVYDISDFFLEENTNIIDLGCSTGKCLNLFKDKLVSKNCSYLGYDNSDAMIKRISKLDLNGVEANFFNQDITSNDFTFTNASLVLSIFTLQFISLKSRQEVVSKIYNGLNKGGGFIFIEKVLDNNNFFSEIYTDLHYKFKMENGYSANEILNKRNSLAGVMKPLSNEENIDMLTNVGFSKVTNFYKWLNFSGYLAIK